MATCDSTYSVCAIGIAVRQAAASRIHNQAATTAMEATAAMSTSNPGTGIRYSGRPRNDDAFCAERLRMPQVAGR